MTSEPPHAPSPRFLEVFERQADAAGVMTFARFVDLALYDPAVGYYSRARPRIGRGPATDFYTAPALGPVFGELVADAAATLLHPAMPAAHTFVEIGVEPPAPGGSVRPASGATLAGVAHPFAAATTVSLGQPVAIPPRAVVFANELFDAQPFHRLVFLGGAWRESGVARQGGALGEVLLAELSPAVQSVRDLLPASAPEGYRIDLPLAAARLAGRIAAAPWSGLFIAIDYGKPWLELVTATPAGTARAYHRHRQGDDLLARPGEQDLTCHVCWDWLTRELAAHGFAAPVLESQEAFFVHHSARMLQDLTEAGAGGLNPRKLALMQLLHPGNMGQKFQVLWARRGPA